MVEIFDVITQAMKEKKTADPADQLEYAAKLLRQKSTSGSGKVYADNLETAAKQVTGKEINIGMILTILQILMGTKQKGGSGSGDLLSTLLGSLLSGGQKSGGADSGMGDLLGSLIGQKSGGADSGMGDLLGSLMGQKSSGSDTGMGDLLGSLMGQKSGSSGGADSGMGDLLGSLMGQKSGSSGSSNQGIDLGDLLGAGLSQLSNSPNGKSGLDALTGALLSGSQMAESGYRQQSGEVVTKAALNALSSMLRK
jgi:hypothetical protein